MINITNKQKLLLLQISISFAAVGVAGSVRAIDMNAAGQWASASNGAGTGASIAQARGSSTVDTVNITGNATLTISNTGGTANDGNGLDTFVVGGITNTSGVGNVTVETGRTPILPASALTTTIDYVSISGAFSSSNRNVDDANVATTITGSLAATLGVFVSNNETTTTKTSALTVGGNLTSGGAVNITAGNATSAHASLTLSGDSNVATTGFTLTDAAGGAGGRATLSFQGDTQTVSGTINGASSGDGAVLVGGDSVTFSGNIGATMLHSFQVSSGKTATLNGSILGAETITNSGTMVFGTTTTASFQGSGFANEGTLTLNNKLTLSGGQVDLNSSGTDSTGIITMGTSTYTDNTMINVNGVSAVNATNIVKVVPVATFNSGTITVVKSIATGTARDADKFTATNNVITNYTFSLDSSDINMTATPKPVSDIASSLQTTQFSSEALLRGLNATTSDTTINNAYANAVSSGGSAARIAAEQSAMNPDGGSARTSLQNAQIVLNSTSQRLDGLRDGAGTVTTLGMIQSAGLSAGNAGNTMGIWVRPYAYLGTQDDIDRVAGYESKTQGITGGFDKLITDNIRLGFSVGYSNANVQSGGFGKNETDVKGKQTTLYGDYTADSYFIEAMLGYATNTVNTSRVITFGGLNQKALGEYNAHQYFARMSAGLPVAFGSGNHHVLTPEIGLDLSRLTSDAYTETGAGVLNLQVTPAPVNVALATAGLQYKYKHGIRNGVLSYVTRFGAGYDLVNDNGIATMKFASGSTSFSSTAPDISPLEGHAGLGIGYNTFEDQFRLMLNYDAEVRESFLGHTVRLEWRYNF
jgi:uncharacterized protein with beta-barrel porin domain